MLFAWALCAAPAWSDLEAFSHYNGVKEAAKKYVSVGQFSDAANEYVMAGKIAEKYATKEIAAWQYTNAGISAMKQYYKNLNIDNVAAAMTFLRYALELNPKNEVAERNMAKCELLLKLSKE